MTNVSRNAGDALRVQMLDGFAVTRGDRSLDDAAWRLRNANRLVKLLALAHGHALQRDEIIEWLWPELDPPAAANNLRYTLHVSRRAFSPLSLSPRDVLRLTGGRVSLSPGLPVLTDVDAFERAAGAALATRDPAACRAALDLYRGDLLPDDRYEDWAAGRRESLRGARLLLLSTLASVEEAAGDHQAAIDMLRRLVEADPASEDAHAGLMRLYALSGQRRLALRQYQQLRDTMRRELDIEPEPESQRLYQDILTGRFRGATPAMASGDVVTGEGEQTGSGSHNLPTPLTSFVGRQAEMATISRLLDATRLLTLTGGGGAGKTRLAVETARARITACRDGVWMIDLSALADPGLLQEVIAESLGVEHEHERQATDALVDALRPRSLLLVLDNCEHLAVACADFVCALLRGCPDVSVLATSREPLRVPGERSWSVPPLALPDDEDTVTVQQASASEAVRLFSERAALAQPGFRVTAENAATVAAICRQLDGNALAIELAAARLTVLTPQQLAARLGDALHVLTGGSRTAPPRQQTLRATLDWSHDLLTGEERAVLRALAVFAGGWTLEAAEAVCSRDDIAPHAVLELLARLVDKSLVVVDLRQQAARYRLLETVRQYAVDRLVDSGEADALRQRHAAWFLALADEAEPALHGPSQPEWIERLDAERDNLRAALAWLRETDLEGALRLAAALGAYWWKRGHYGEGRAGLMGLLVRDDPAVSPATRTRALTAAIRIIYRQGDYPLARDLCEENLTLQRRIGDSAGVAASLGYLAMVVGELGDIERSRSLLLESLALSRELGDIPASVRALNSLGEIARIQRDLDRAAAHYEESLALARSIDERQYIAIVLHNLGYVARARNDASRAADLFQESLAHSHALGNQDLVASSLAGLASVATTRGEHAQAVRLFASADALHRAIGTPEDAADAQETQRCLAELRDALGDDGFQEAWAAGSALPVDDAIREALATRCAPRQSDPSPAASLLSPREREVAALVARGLTNQQIAAELGLSARTADTHVSRILRKLGVRSRAEVRG